MSNKVEKHKVVSFTFSFLNEKGEILEQNNVAVDYVHGSGERTFPLVMSEALEGTTVGESKEILLKPEDGFGSYDENKTYRAKIEDVPPEYNELGAQAIFKNEDDIEIMMTVVSIENGEVFLDGNHPFAGKTLTVRMTVEAVRDATVEEIGSGLSNKYQQNQHNNNKVH